MGSTACHEQHGLPSLDRLRSLDAGARRQALADALAEHLTHAQAGSVTGRAETQLIELLVASLSDEHPGVQQAAVNGLAAIGGAAVATRLMTLLREPPAVRNMAVEVIEQLAPDAMLCTLPVLRDADSNVRKLIVDALGKRADARFVEPLLPMLSDPDPNVRAAAAEALGHMKAASALRGLIALLQDEEWVVFSAVSALAEIGDPAALLPLLDLIGRGGPLARYAAIEAIGGLDAEGLSPASLVTMIETAGNDLRPALVKALVAVTERKDPTIWAMLDRGRWVELLSGLLDQEDESNQLAAMTGLGFLGDRRGTKPVLDCYRTLAQPTEDIAECAVGALVGTGDCAELIGAIQSDDDPAGPIAIRALGELQSREAVAALIAVRRTSRDWERRRLALRALGMVGTAEAWDGIQEAIDDPTGYVRCEAASLLGASDQEAVVNALLDRLTMERYQEVRDEIVETLARVGGRQVMQALVGLLSHGRREVRASAATAIGLARPQEGLGALMDALNDVEWRVRQAVIEALGHFDDPRALEPLMLALSDDHEKVRLAATVGVSRWDQPEARQALMTHCLADADIWVRYRAAERLGHWKVAEAVPHLAALAARRREPALLRRAAIASLGQIGGDARAALAGLRDQEDGDVREAAERALAEDGAEGGNGGRPWS